MPSSVIPVILLVLLAISLSVTVYLATVGIPAKLPNSRRASLFIEEAEIRGDTARLYIANRGEVTAVLDKYFIISDGSVVDTGDVKVEEYVESTKEFEVSPGDVYRFTGNTLELVERRIALSRGPFGRWPSSGFSPRSYNVESTSAAFGSYLKLSAKRSSSSGWGTYSMLYTDPVNVSEGLIVEVGMEKDGWNSAKWWFSAALYITASNTHPDPYYDKPWIAVKLYPRYSGTVYTQAQIVGRTSSGSLGVKALANRYSGEVRATFLLIIMPKDSGVSIKYCFWHSFPIVHPRKCTPVELTNSVIKNAAKEILNRGEAWIFLTIETATNTYVNSAIFYYVRVLEGINVTVKDLPQGAEVSITSDGDTLAKASENSGVAILDGLGVVSYDTPPFNANITVGYTALADVAIPPGGMAVVDIPIPDDKIIQIKVVSKDGAIAYTTLRRRG